MTLVVLFRLKNCYLHKIQTVKKFMTKIKIEFAEGCFDDFDGTQEELAEIIAELHKIVESGDFEERSRRLSPEEEEDVLEIMANREKRQ